MITLPKSNRLWASPLANLTPQALSRQLDEFASGHFATIARTWEAIERRDDILKGVAGKRKKAPARLPWQVIADDNTPEAEAQRILIRDFLLNLRVTAADDRNLHGGLSLLIEQMMDAVGKRYACHEVAWQNAPDGSPTALLQFVPLWAFENRAGSLHFIDDKSAAHPLDPVHWMVSMGDGLMEASSIAYLYKHLPLRDWLLYCERNGMPGVKGTTTAQPGSAEWEEAKAAVENFGAQFTALVTPGASIDAIDLSTRGELPYPKLVERMDQAIAALWRGSDLSTLSSNGIGASLQKGETELIEAHDAQWIADTLNSQLITQLIARHFGQGATVRARLAIQPPTQLDRIERIFRLLNDLHLPIPADALYERLGLQPPAKPAPTEPTPTTPAAL